MTNLLFPGLITLLVRICHKCVVTNVSVSTFLIRVMQISDTTIIHIEQQSRLQKRDHFFAFFLIESEKKTKPGIEMCLSC